MSLRRVLISTVVAGSLLLASCSTDNAATKTAESAAAAASSVASAAGSAVSGAASSAAAKSTDSQAATGEVTVEDNSGSHTLTRPFKSVAVLDNRSFEILADWGVPITAAPLDLVPSTLKDKLNANTVGANIGNHREPNLEAMVAANPDLVINGQRFVKYEEDIKKLMGDVPVLDFEPRDGQDLSAELIRQTEALGKIFGHEADAQKLVDDYNAAVSRAKAAYNSSQKVMAINTSGGKTGFIAPGQGRVFGPVFRILGLTPALEVSGASSNHEGDDISVEAIAQANPDWIFILDRDAAVGAKDGVAHGEALIKENAALQNVTAVKEGHIVTAPADTYTNENIITYTEIFNQIADAFEAAK